MTNWTTSKTTMDGITVELLEADNNGYTVWKRSDGFGHMSDAEVTAYKAARPSRYLGDYVTSLLPEVVA